MTEYHEIQTVYERDPANNNRTLLDGVWARPEFEYLAGNRWVFTEKIDGTNVRVTWDTASVGFGGKTDEAQMPVALVKRLGELFTVEGMAAAFPTITPTPTRVTDPGFPSVPLAVQVVLYGEGYGARIQKGGGNYSPTAEFILFDVAVGGLFLAREDVTDIADKLAIRVVPEVGRGTLRDAVEIVRNGFKSTFGSFPAEGLVMRPDVELQTRRGHRVIAKVKHKDFGPVIPR